MAPRGRIAERGTVIDNFEIGRIQPEGGGDTVSFAPPSVQPPGNWPDVGDGVEFIRYADHANWAKSVKKI